MPNHGPRTLVRSLCNGVACCFSAIDKGAVELVISVLGHDLSREIDLGDWDVDTDQNDTEDVVSPVFMFK